MTVYLYIRVVYINNAHRYFVSLFSSPFICQRGHFELIMVRGAFIHRRAEHLHTYNTYVYIQIYIITRESHTQKTYSNIHFLIHTNYSNNGNRNDRKAQDPSYIRSFLLGTSSTIALFQVRQRVNRFRSSATPTTNTTTTPEACY